MRDGADATVPSSRQQASSNNHTTNISTFQKPYSSSKSTQTFDDNMSHCVYIPTSNDNNAPNTSLTTIVSDYAMEKIYSVIDPIKTLPLINIQVAKTSISSLLDSGSSISVISKNFYDSVKNQIKSKLLSRHITITTINSAVQFQGCAEISFKIGQTFYRHPFYIIPLSNQSPFTAILGLDFMYKYGVIIDIKNSTINIKDKTIIFKNNFNCSEQVQNCNILQYPHIPNQNITNANSSNAQHERSLSPFNNTINEEDTCQIVDDIFDLTHDNNVANRTLLPSTATVNNIQASNDTLKLRREEFNIQVFQMQHLTHSERLSMQNILSQNWSAFSSSLKTLGHTDLIIPKIKFTQDYPMKSLPFPIPNALQAETKRQIDELLEAGIITKNVSDWASPMLLVKKKLGKDGIQKYRLALDLRLINSIIVHSSYPLPKIQDIVSNIAQYKFYTTLDMPNAYHQIHLPEEYGERLSFTTPFGTYRYNRLVFGLKTAASFFQALIDKVLEEANIQGCFGYQDDIVLCSNSFQESCEKLTKILDLFQKYNLTLCAAKCKFHQESINYLGFNISQNVIKPIEANVIKITSFPTPKTKRQLKRFIGLCGFYRHLIPQYAKIMQPLVDLTSPMRQFTWNEYLQNTFKTIQAIFFKYPFLRQPNWNETFYLNTDASKQAISAVLLQKFNNDLLPISYFSKSLNKAEQNYPAIKLELMAITKGIQAFKYYLYNRHFIILSDSQPLKYYKKTQSPADLITRWLLLISEYSFTFEHIKGTNNVLSDYLSRLNEPPSQDDIQSDPTLISSKDILPITENDTQINQSNSSNTTLPEFNNVLNAIQSDLKDPLLEISNSTFLKHQLTDLNTSLIYNAIMNREQTPTLKNYVIDPDTKLLFYTKYDIDNADSELQHDNKPFRIVVPKVLIPKVLRIVHLPHFGRTKTYEFLCRKYFWKGCYKDLMNFIASCKQCATTQQHRLPTAPLQPMPIPTHPSEIISMDLVGPFETGHTILTVTDHFSRHVELYPIKSISANIIMEKLFEYITTHGRPTLILTDLGSQFISEIFNNFTKIFGIQLQHTTPGHPASNGISERINILLKKSIRALQLQGTSFNHAVAIQKAFYNSSTHSASKFSPNLIHFGRELSLLTDTFHPHMLTQILDTTHKLHTIFDVVKSIYDQTYENLQVAQDNSRARQHRTAKLREFNVGDTVYIKSVDKFKPKFTGPFEVVTCHNDVNVSIRRLSSPNAPSKKYHINRLFRVPKRLPHLIHEQSDGCTSNKQVSTPCPSPAYNLRSRIHAAQV